MGAIHQMFSAVKTAETIVQEVISKFGGQVCQGGVVMSSATLTDCTQPAKL